MIATLEEQALQFRRVIKEARAPATMSDLDVEIDVTELPPCLQPRPSQWFADALSQLDRLLELPPNWDSYNADPPSADAAASARGLVLALGQSWDLPAPLVSPTRTGGVLLEWASGSKELEIEIVSRDAASFVFTDDYTGEEYEGAIFRDNVNDDRFFKSLKRLSE